jgi:GT2 family glycosyltransferase
MAGCLVLNEDGTEQRGCRRNIPDPKRSLYRFTGLSRWFPEHFADFNAVGTALPDAPTPVEAISGAFMLVRRDAFEAVGGWDEGYFLHCEDLDLCQRFRDHGHDILFVPAARAVHIQGTSSKGRPIRVEWHKHQGMWRFYRKFQAPSNPAAFNALVRLGIATHFLLTAARLAPRALRLTLSRRREQGAKPRPSSEGLTRR